MKKLLNIIRVQIFFIFITTFNFTQAQIQVTSNVTPLQMADFLAGSGVEIIDAVYTGAEDARGLFYGADTSGFIMEEGIALTSGNLNIIPGPNLSSSSGVSNGLPGDPDLEALIGYTTYDAAILELTLKPEGDSLFFNFAFGSEEYNEWVNGAYSEGCGIFFTGTKPGGGSYDMENLAWVPGTSLPVTINNVNNGYAAPGVVPTGPCINCEYYNDNTGGMVTEYDGFTSVIDSSVLVYPDSVYQLKIVVADAGDHIYDCGIFLEKYSLYSPTTADFYSFEFDTLNNPGLLYNVTGELYHDSIFISIPYIPDLTDLVATFSLSPGATANVGNTPQQSGVTPNDFTNPVTYTVTGANNYVKDWVVIVSVLPSHLNNILSFSFETANNPFLEEDVIGQITGDSIHIGLPFGSSLESLIASFTLSDFATAYINGVFQTSGVTVNNFTSIVTYEIEAENGDIKQYGVYAEILENTENDILVFTFEDELNPQLNTDIVGILGDTTVDLYAPIGTDLSNLIATFVLSEEADAYISGVIQQTTITANDFTNPVTYQVVAQNGDEKNWLVTVHLVTGQINERIENISVYPNPVKDEIYINQAKGFELLIINSLGVKLFHGKINTSHFSVDVCNFEEGVYYLQFTNDQKWFVEKVIINR